MSRAFRMAPSCRGDEKNVGRGVSGRQVDDLPELKTVGLEQRLDCLSFQQLETTVALGLPQHLYHQPLLRQALPVLPGAVGFGFLEEQLSPGFQELAAVREEGSPAHAR